MVRKKKIKKVPLFLRLDPTLKSELKMDLQKEIQNNGSTMTLNEYVTFLLENRQTIEEQTRKFTKTDLQTMEEIVGTYGLERIVQLLLQFCEKNPVDKKWASYFKALVTKEEANHRKPRKHR
jgi:enoyl reductase-like protein